MTPKDLAKAIWNTQSYREECLGKGRFAAEIIKDVKGDRYTADYKHAMDALNHTHTRLLRAASSSDPEVLETIRHRVLEQFSKPKTPPLRGQRSHYTRKVEENASLVGSTVRASLAKEELVLDRMTIKDIEEMTRNLNVAP